ncbi:MAG: PilZ domain-containing protein [Planctomycetes bacterium]|nr:PilZ domain-containing protein [Planctomycetota bacterium]
MPERGSEKRKDMRLPIKGGMVQYKESGGIFALFKGSSDQYPILNLSLRGMRFLTTDSLLSGDKLNFTIGVPTLGGEPLKAEGRVAWVQRSPRYKANVIGVQFVAMTKDSLSRLKNLVSFLGTKMKIKYKVKVYFSEQMRQKATVWELARDFNVSINLLEGSLNDKTTWLTIEIEGEKEEVKRVLEYLKSGGAKLVAIK